MKRFFLLMVALAAPQSAAASVYADLANQNVVGINDGLGIVEITDGLSTVKMFSEAARRPPGTSEKLNKRATAPMTVDGLNYYIKKFLEKAPKSNSSDVGSSSLALSPEVKKECMQAADFAGCVKVLGGSSTNESEDIRELRRAMKKVAARIENGISYNDSTEAFQPLVDQLALARDENYGELTVTASEKAEILFNIMQSAWYSSIRTKSEKIANSYIYRWNKVIGTENIKPFKARNCLGFCVIDESTYDYLLSQMRSFIVGLLKEGAVSREKIDQYNSLRDRLMKSSRKSAWSRHLEADPALKQWALNNPGLAENEMIKFNLANPSKALPIQTYQETQHHLKVFSYSLF